MINRLCDLKVPSDVFPWLIVFEVCLWFPGLPYRPTDMANIFQDEYSRFFSFMYFIVTVCPLCIFALECDLACLLFANSFPQAWHL